MGLFRRRKVDQEADLTRIFFVTDIHGSDLLFRKFLNAAKFYKAQTLILGGDITGKVVVPVVDMGNGTYEAELFGRPRVARSTDELGDLVQAIQDAGYYPWHTAQRRMPSEAEQAEIFAGVVEASLRYWLALAEERLNGTSIRCFLQLGNDDEPAMADIFVNACRVEYPEDRVVRVDDEHEMVSLGFSNPTPWRSPREIPEKALAARIDAMASRVANMPSAIFNLHVPPYDSGLDTAQAVTEDLRPISDGGNPRMVPIGSHAVRAAIERYQPLLALHGHVHDSRGIARIGRTLCINPGSEYTDGILRGAIIDLSKDRVMNYQLTAG